MTTPALIRFRYIDPETDDIYVGEAEIEDESPIGNRLPGNITILSCWLYGMTIEEAYPYAIDFPIILRKAIEATILEQLQCPPASPVELPTDWDAIEIIDTETTYTIAVKDAILPDVKTDLDVKVYGLQAVSRVQAINGDKQYRITAKGGLDDIRRELQRIRLF